MKARSAGVDGAQTASDGRQAVLTRHRFSVDDYYAMARAGILNEDSRVELLDGEVVDMTPIEARHAACVKRLNQLFSMRLGGRAVVSVQDPVRLDRYSEPEPDIALLEPPIERYERAHPGPGDVLLVVEVADTSLLRDRQIKLLLFARAGITEVWLVNLEGGELEVYRDPTEDGYAQARRMREGTVRPLALASLEINVEEILGAASEG